MLKVATATETANKSVEGIFAGLAESKRVS